MHERFISRKREIIDSASITVSSLIIAGLSIMPENSANLEPKLIIAGSASLVGILSGWKMFFLLRSPKNR